MWWYDNVSNTPTRAVSVRQAEAQKVVKQYQKVGISSSRTTSKIALKHAPTCRKRRKNYENRDVLWALHSIAKPFSRQDENRKHKKGLPLQPQ